MNAVLIRKREERADQLAFVDELLSKVEADGGRDLVDAELKNLEAARQRVQELDAQITPLEEHETMTARHRETAGAYVPQDRPAALRPLAGGGNPIPWTTPGAFMADLLRARGLLSDTHGRRLPADPEAASRINYVLANQTTADTPGLLPHPIVGSVVSLIDATRPFITSVGGGRPMGGIPGKTFGRPKITQHVQVGVQAAEKTEVATRKMTIGEIAFTKATYGGAVDVSRQDIDWSSPAAWDILVRDLADVYAMETENAAADAFAAGAAGVNTATAIVPPVTLANLAPALYTAAGKVYANGKRLPDRIWMSADLWGVVGPLLDNQQSTQDAGDSSLSSFSGNLYGVQRIVVPSFPASTLIVGASTAFEVYEEAIGLLTAVEPSLLGVEVAYGGYIAFNYVAPEQVAPITGAVLLSADAEKEGKSK